jgi:hypothetical protein
MHLFKHWLVALLTAALTTTTLSVVLASPATADDIVFYGAGTLGSNGLQCSQSQVGPTKWEKDDEWVQAVLTDFTAINVAPGTTTSRTDTLSHVATVTQQVTNSSGGTVSSSVGFDLIAKVAASVSLTYNRTVSTTQTTTDTSTESVTWNISQPGLYGLYRGTIRDDTTVRNSTCVYQSPGHYVWSGQTYYITVFTAPEEGSVLCTGSVDNPQDDGVLAAARRQLGSC